jgi:hypothetical protein
MIVFSREKTPVHARFEKSEAFKAYGLFKFEFLGVLMGFER